MGKESPFLTSVSKPEFTPLDDGIYSVSLKIKKGTGQNWQNRFNQLVSERVGALYRFPSHLGYQLDAEVVSLTATEYDESYTHDVLDLLVRLTKEQWLLIVPPEISTEFGY